MHYGSELVSFGEKTNMSQSAMNDAWELLSAQEQAIEEVSMLEIEMQKLGDNAVERIKVVEQYMKNNLDGDTYERLRYAVNSAEAVELIEALVKFNRSLLSCRLMATLSPVVLRGKTSKLRCLRSTKAVSMLRSVDPNHEPRFSA